MDEFVVPEQPAGSASAAASAGERPDLRIIGGTASRAERYYKTSAQAPAMRSVTNDELDVLRAIQDAGNTADLILAFGPHTGETLGQVARNDPDYLRTLATKAQRPDVRAAAARVVSVLPQPTAARRVSSRPGRPRKSPQLMMGKGPGSGPTSCSENKKTLAAVGGTHAE